MSARTIAKHPWNDWYHIMGHTYGTWLPGDPRGFRTRHHREHVEGDYKNPPPGGKYAKRWKRAKQLMKRDPVYLTWPQRQRAVDEFASSFKKWNIELRILSIDRIHLHALLRALDHNPRHWVGLAKKECSAYMRRDHLAPDGGLWAVRCECLPIADPTHFENVTAYIADHANAGGVIYDAIAATIQWNIDIDPSELLIG